MSRVLLVTACAAFALAAPASASRIVLAGVAEVGPGGSNAFPFLPLADGLAEGTKYTLAVRFSRPALSFIAEYGQYYCYEAFDGAGGEDQYCDYDRFWSARGHDTAFASVTFTTSADRSTVIVNSDGYLEGSAIDYWTRQSDFRSDFASFEPVGYRFVLFDSVPEPTGWAMMIAGFGLAGSGLRLRRTARSTAVA